MEKIISKTRSEPLLLEGLDAAINRLAPGHAILPVLNRKYSAVKAGFGGEQQVDRIFQNYTFPLEYRVIHDLSLTSRTHFQIDTLFITQSYAVVFEIKNISGSLKVIENPPQLVRTLDNGEVKGFNSPIAQLQNNCELLRDWLHRRNMAMPIYSAVVLAYPTQRIDLFDTNIPFLFPSTIPTFIRNLPMHSPLLDFKSFIRLTKELINNHKEFIPKPICTTYSIQRNEIMTGVACPFCGFLGMRKYMKGWRCTACHRTSPNAHEQTIRDWFFLFGGKMTNKDCREFLQIERQQTAYRILQSMNLSTEGANRNRTYSMSPLHPRK